jgi:aminoglycoside/choline kinase family phosphotransferase
VKQRLKPSTDSANDLRREALSAWIAERLPGEAFTLAPASADASFRRYFRVTLDGVTRIAMDAPPEREDSRLFIHVAQLMRDAGVHVPEVLAADTAQGFMLLTDLGNTTYLKALTDDNADALFRDAIAALITWQRASRPMCCRPMIAHCCSGKWICFPTGTSDATSVSPSAMPSAKCWRKSINCSPTARWPSPRCMCTATTCRAT